MTSHPQPVHREHLCSHHASSCPPLRSRVSLLPLFRCFRVTWSLTVSSKMTGCPGWPSTRCLHWSGRPTVGAFQRNFLSHSGRSTTGESHSALFPLQLLDLAHRWSERQDNHIHIFDVLSLAARIYILVKMDPAPAQGPQQTARPTADLFAAIARLFARRQPDSAPSLHTGWTIQQIVTEEYRILEVPNYELATHTPAAWTDVCEQRQVETPAPFRWYLPTCLLTVCTLLLKRTFGTSPLPWIHVGASVWFLSAASWICLGSA